LLRRKGIFFYILDVFLEKDTFVIIFKEMDEDNFKKQNIWFWLIAISLMVVAMCILSLQLIELHRENDLEIKKTTRCIANCSRTNSSGVSGRSPGSR
jgi:hypothetical protein